MAVVQAHPELISTSAGAQPAAELRPPLPLAGLALLVLASKNGVGPTSPEESGLMKESGRHHLFLGIGSCKSLLTLHERNKSHHISWGPRM